MTIVKTHTGTVITKDGPKVKKLHQTERIWGRCQKQVNCCTPTLRRNPIAARRQTKDGFR